MVKIKCARPKIATKDLGGPSCRKPQAKNGPRATVWESLVYGNTMVSSGTNCLNLFQPILILASTAASASPSTLKMSPEVTKLIH